MSPRNFSLILIKTLLGLHNPPEISEISKMLIRLQEPLGPWVVNSISSAMLPIQLLPMENIYNSESQVSFFLSVV